VRASYGYDANRNIEREEVLDEAGYRRRWESPGDSPPDPATRQGRVPTAEATAPTRLLGATRCV